MNKLLISLLLFTTVNNVNAFTHESNFRANETQLLVQTGILFSETISSDDGSESNSSSRAIPTTLAYGITKDISLISTLNFNEKNQKSGFGNYNLGLKGQNSNLVYEARYYFSPDDAKSNNFYTGGDYIRLKLGYQINENYGVKLSYRPSYDYNVDGVSGSYSRGRYTAVIAYYETTIDNVLYGIDTSYGGTKATVYPTSGTVYEDSTYWTVSPYFNIKANSFEFLPSLAWIKYLGEDEDFEQTITDFSLLIRKRF